MVLIQVNIPKELNKKLRHYLIDENIEDKRIAIVKILEEKFEVKK